MQTLKDNNLTGNAATSRRRQRGFTLIELVVVLAVLGVLAAIGIPQLTGLQQTAELRGISANLASEAGNLFAQDLASGAIDADSSNGVIGWTTPCGDFDGDVLPSSNDLPVDWSITGDESDGEFSFGVPTHAANNGGNHEIGEGTNCYLTDN